jgi:hemerythrin superfamily protein
MSNTNPLISCVAPKATTMIRLDHAHVMVTFHQYTADTPPNIKKGLVDTACTALEIHAQLEEEIFYPAVRAVADSETAEKSVPEHDEMRRLIARLRSMQPTSADYDDTFMELMRDVLHHVADEETVLLPQAERLLADRLGELGAEMTQRRLALTIPRTGEIAVSMFRATPLSKMAIYGAAALGAWVALRHVGNPLRRRPGFDL